MRDAAEWIARLDMVKHPEGGYYREIYRSNETIAHDHLPERFGGDRVFSTAIVFLLRAGEFSALHRIKQDEVWHHYDGAALTIHVIDPNGGYTPIELGCDIEKGERPQVVVRAGCLFGTTVSGEGTYALVGCTVAPGFEFDDFEMPDRDTLAKRYPQHQAIIEKLTRR
ncbi:MAG: cupin domain-containing protein [Candidatus Latescibacterota bacterium]|nr:MAG: cupin domain-containing protein [Candidatus Latescibacterota bacterium]